MLGLTGLGLVASGKRSILPGYEFDNLYDRNGLLGTNPIIGGDLSDTYDTLNHMAEIVRDTLVDTEKISSNLKGSSLEETLRNDWNHVYRHFQYEKDATGIEQIRRPSRSWVDRKKGIDCDCMSVVLSSLLHHQKIPHAFRKATYNEETGWQHVYVIVPKKGINLNEFIGSKKVARNKYYVLDCVVDKFDYEVPPLKKFDKVMKIQYLNGLDAATVNGGITPQTESMLTTSPFSVEELLGVFGNEFTELNGLEGSDQKQIQNAFLRGLKQHLINTRSILSINPALTAGLYSPTLFAQRLDALINAFDDNELRFKVLGELAALETREELNGLGSVGLGKGFFRKIGQGLKKVGRGIANAAKTVAKAVVRFNPATIAIRNGVLLAMKLNLFRLAEKLGYGYWTEEQAKAKGLDLNQFRKNKKALEKVRSIQKAIGGKVAKLDNAIREGWRKGVKKHHGVSGLGAAPLYVKTRVNAAMPLLQLVGEHLKDISFNSLFSKVKGDEMNNFFQALRTNINGIATKLSLAYKPSQEASQYEKNEYKKLLDRVRAVERLVISKGGTPSQLRSAVEAGKQVALNKKSLSQKPLGVLPAAIAPAAATLAKIGSLLKSVDYKSLLKGALKNKVSEFVKSKTSASTNSNADNSTQAAAIQSSSANSSTDDSAQDMLTDLVTKNPKVAKAFSKVKKAAKQFKASGSSSSSSSGSSSRNGSSDSGQSSGDDVQDTTAEVVETKLSKPKVGSQSQDNASQDDASDDKQDAGAQLVTTKTNSAGDKKDMLKYIAIGGAALTGLFILSRAFQSKPAAPKVEAASSSPPQPMSGVKTKSKSKHKSSQRTRKKVMAITM